VLVPVDAGAAGLFGFGSPGYNAKKIKSVSKRALHGAIMGINGGGDFRRKEAEGGGEGMRGKLHLSLQIAHQQAL